MQVQKEEAPKIEQKEISKKEQERRSALPIVEAESRLKRIGDEIIFEITVPGIKSKEEISITQLEKGIEIKVYTKDLCYTKTIPLEPEKINLKIQKDKVIVEGINMVKKHQKARKQGEKGGIIDKPMPIHISNVKKI